jgi:RNA polymerase sigma-70 factor (ECF subfamily)
MRDDESSSPVRRNPTKRPHFAHGPGLAMPSGMRTSRNAAATQAMTRCKIGDPRAFAEVYRLVAPRLRAYVTKRTRDAETAEDIVQFALFRMHRARARYEVDADAMAWAFSIVRRLLVDYHRQCLRAVRVMGANAAAHVAAVDDPERLVMLRQAIRRLHAELVAMPAPHRAAFELLKREGLSIAEAATRLETPPTAVKLRAHRAYQALRGAMREVA